MAAEPERVAQGGAHGALLGLVEGEVEVVVDLFVAVVVLMVDGRGHDVVLHGQDAGQCLDGAGGTEQVARHGLGRGDVELVGVLAEHFLDGFGLGDVAHVGGGAVYVDVVDVLGLQACIIEGVLHHQDGTQSFGVGGGDVVGVGTHAFTGHLGVDLRAAGFGVLQLLKDEAPGTFAHDEAVAAGAEGAAGLLRLIVAGGEGFHGVETADATFCDGSLGTAADNHVGLAQTDEVEGISQGVGAGGAGGGRHVVGAVEAIEDADVPGGDIGNHLGDEEGSEFGADGVSGTLVAAQLLLKGLDAADADAIDDAHAVLVNRVEIHGAVLDGLLRSGDGVLAVEIHLAGFLAVDTVGFGVKVLHLASELGLEFFCVEMRNRTCAALAGYKVLPGLVNRVAQRGDGAESCYYDSF